MSFDDFAIMDDAGADVDLDQQITLNSGSNGVNVKQFDLAGAMLGMTYDEINNLFFNSSSLYAPVKNNSIVYTINKEWKYNLDYECRQNNIFVPDQLEKCINSLAQNRGLLYVSEIHLERTFTGETLDIYFTSNATDNVVWKVVYNNDVDTMEGEHEKFANQREKKMLAFWQGIIDKYGTPNSDEDKWISSELAFDPMMQALYGQLILVDNGLNAIDSSENIQKARENFQAKPYAF
jgi:maltose-binding protein MalE